MYLTEKFLGELLKEIFPNNEFINDKSVPNSNTRRRPDYRCDELMLIVEFDGDLHYKESGKIKSEAEKNSIYSSMGYKVVRIPYFIQLTNEIVKLLFNKDCNISYKYPHGFISDKATLPADFCEMGINKFISDLNKFKIVKQDILNSLVDKIESKKDIELVLPKSLYSLIKN